MAHSDSDLAPSGLQAPGVVDDGRALMGLLAEADVAARLLGGVAVAMRCPSVLPPSPLARSYSDFDIVVSRVGGRSLGGILQQAGFRGADRFNAMNGQTRQLYARPDGVEIDVFVSKFRMCHKLDFKTRLEVDALTVPLAELMLTKLQVIRLTRKDVTDVAGLLIDHELTDDDAGISITRLCAVTGGDWGWWRTVTGNLTKVLDHLPALDLPLPDAARVESATRAILTRMQDSPKSLRWRTRAALGDRVAWYEDPDEKH
jgi:hypothetical protein